MDTHLETERLSLRRFTADEARAETMALNAGSRNVMEKLEMRQVRTIPTPDDMLMVEGSELGGVRYEIAKEQP